MAKNCGKMWQNIEFRNTVKNGAHKIGKRVHTKIRKGCSAENSGKAREICTLINYKQRTMCASVGQNRARDYGKIGKFF